MKILVTGFEPWGNWTRNPSGEIAKALSGRKVNGVDLVGVVLPVVHGEDIARVRAHLAEDVPDAVISLGLGPTPVLNVERVAVNLKVLSEDSGQRDEPIVPDGPAAYFATVPTRAMAAAIQAHGVPARLSYSAGTFLCNHIMYSVLHEVSATQSRTLAGFIHIPPMPEQVEAGRARASMALEVTQKGVEAAISAVALACGSRMPA